MCSTPSSDIVARILRDSCACKNVMAYSKQVLPGEVGECSSVIIAVVLEGVKRHNKWRSI